MEFNYNENRIDYVIQTGIVKVIIKSNNRKMYELLANYLKSNKIYSFEKRYVFNNIYCGVQDIIV